MNFYVLISGLIVGFTLLVVFVIIFTPLKRYIPGYGGIGSQRDMFVLEERVDSLERAINAHETYATNVRKMLTADVQRESDIPKDIISAVADSNINVEPSEAEMKIRAGGNSPFDGDEEAGSSGEGTKAIKVSGRGDRLEKMFLASPISGQVSLDFSLNKKHYGIDIIAPKNTPIKTIADGFVISADWTLETGNTIAILKGLPAFL